MTSPIISDAPFVVLSDKGYMQLYTSTGELVDCNVWLRVTDHAEKGPTVIGQFMCNIVGSVEDMQKAINDRKASR